jgi:hypothetical protein
MKIIITEDQYGQLTEMIKLDIKVGDTIMGGKFKNKKVVVKTIGKNDKGDITINGKPLLRFRILKENNEGNNIPSALRRRINLFDHELNTTLRESEPCEYARFNQYKRGIMNYTLASFLNNENISLDSDENYIDEETLISYLFEIRNYLLNIFENKIRLHYDAYSEIHCPDDPEIVTESKQLKFIRRYQELKDWVRSDYNYLLDQGKSPYDAREMTIDDSAMTYLDDPDTQLEWTDKNLNMLRRFIENNFEDLIS